MKYLIYMSLILLVGSANAAPESSKVPLKAVYIETEGAGGVALAFIDMNNQVTLQAGEVKSFKTENGVISGVYQDCWTHFVGYRPQGPWGTLLPYHGGPGCGPLTNFTLNTKSGRYAEPQKMLGIWIDTKKQTLKAITPAEYYLKVNGYLLYVSSQLSYACLRRSPEGKIGRIIKFDESEVEPVRAVFETLDGKRSPLDVTQNLRELYPLLDMASPPLAGLSAARYYCPYENFDELVKALSNGR